MGQKIKKTTLKNSWSEKRGSASHTTSFQRTNKSRKMRSSKERWSVTRVVMDQWFHTN